MTHERQLERAFQDLGELLVRQEGPAAGDYSQYADDPVGFLREVLGEEPWEKQRVIARAVLEEPQVTVRSCHAAGKDWLAARLALWWVYARRGLVLLSGPTSAQVEEILMRKEIRRAFRAGGLPGELHVRALRPGGEGAAGILARTGRDVSSLTGFHEARVLFILTEAQDPEIDHAWDAAFACATGAEDRILTLGNPTEPSGRFYRAHRPDSGWRAIKIPAREIPNVWEGRTVVSGLLTEAGVRRFKREYGEDSPFVTARVQAEFPEEIETSVFRLRLLEAAATRHEEGTLDSLAEDGPWIAGLDPAFRGPNESILVLRQGPVLQELIALEGEEEALVDRVRRALLGRDLDGKLAALVVDAVGVGAYLADWLAERGLPVLPFNGSDGAGDPDRFANLRAEAHWKLREDLRRGWAALPRDPKLFEELGALRWHPDDRGRIRLEPKTALSGRLGRSPDRADAAVLAFYPVAGPGLETGSGRDPVAAEISGNFLEDQDRDPRQAPDDTDGWTPAGPPIPW